MTDQLLIGLLSSGSVLAGVFLTGLFGEWRARRVERDARESRTDDRRHQLWEMSLPAAGRVQELFLTANGFAQPKPPEFEPTLPFDEGFPDWWEDRGQKLLQDVALIPSRPIRELLDIAADGVSYSYGLTRQTAWAPTYQESVLSTSRLGFEVVSAWMRDESVDSATQAKVNALKASLDNMHAQYADQRRAQQEWAREQKAKEQP